MEEHATKLHFIQGTLYVSLKCENMNVVLSVKG